MLLVDPNSNSRAFYLNGDELDYSTLHVNWIVNITIDYRKGLSISDLHNLTKSDFQDGLKDNWKIDIHDMMVMVATEEVIQHMCVK